MLWGILFYAVYPLCSIAQNSVIDFFHYGNKMMEQNDIIEASNNLLFSGYCVHQISDGIIVCNSQIADIRIASRTRNSQKIDSLRMELRTNAKVEDLKNEIIRMGYKFSYDNGQFSTWQKEDVKVALFSPYNYKDYKIGIIFASVKYTPEIKIVSTEKMETFTIGGVGFNMIRVQGGTFDMGGYFGEEKPVHKVTISSFHIGETEVTQELWLAIMGNKPSKFRGAKRPVEQVSWTDCQDFIKELNTLTGFQFRLPTEAEWEYAAQGGISGNGYKYSGSNDAEDVAWHNRNSWHETHVVGEKKANEIGLYDMSGNVSEWCQDNYGLYSKECQINPVGPTSGPGRVIRGGSFYFEKQDSEVINRGYSKESYRSYSLGFRLAL